MFEDSLMESDNRIKRKSKWSFVAFLLNFGALFALVIWPLLHPEALPTQMMATLMPMGMIFVPSVGGISHSPKELTSWQDCANGANMLLETVMDLAR